MHSEWSSVAIGAQNSTQVFFFLFKGFKDLSVNDQIGLLRNDWSEVLTLSLVFRSLPSTVAAGAAHDKESATMGSIKRQLKFAPDYTLNDKTATRIGLTDFYEQVSNIIDRSDRLGLRKEECILLKAIVMSNCSSLSSSSLGSM